MIHLHVHTYYSFHEGASSPEEIFQAARQQGFNTLAVTDTNGLYGIMHAREAAQRFGIRVLVGAWLQDTQGRSAVLLPRSRKGYSRLCHLITRRHIEQNFRLAEALKGEDLLQLFVLSSDLALLSSLPREKTVFFELNPRSQALYRAARSLGFPPVATNVVYFARPEGYQRHRLLRTIGLNTVFSRLEPTSHAGRDQWLKPVPLMERRFGWCPEALRNTRLIAEGIEEYWDLGAWIVPAEAMERRNEPFALLVEKCKRGVRKRYGRMSPQIRERLAKELKIIEQKGFAQYFLIMEDLAKQTPYTCGRGSSAASLVSYLLGITHVDPIRYDLFFERFLNESRRDPPDIDVDFPWDERERILRYLFDKYGHEKTAMVANHVTYQKRAALREVARVHGFSEKQISLAAKQIAHLWGEEAAAAEWAGNEAVRYRGLRNPGFEKAMALQEAPWGQILRQARSILGFPKYLSVHCGGVIIVPEGVANYVPMEPSRDGRRIIQWEKEGAEEAGLVKMDILGNRSLAVIRDTLRQVRAHYGIHIPYRHFNPLKDRQAQEIMQKGDTMGIFYVESPAMRNLQKKAGVGDYEHLVIHSSIIRPAANRFIDEYVRRLHGKPYRPFHPAVRDLLKETFGIMVYQEDISRVAMALAGFSPEEADELRKAMTRKRDGGRFEAYQRCFEERARARGVPEEALTEIREMIESFRGYSFCKPHSASFAMVSYKSAYLKAHYPAEFMAAVISNQGGFYSTFAYVSEAKRMGLRVLLPDINRSEFHYRAEEIPEEERDSSLRCASRPSLRKALRVGFMQVKGLTRKTVDAVIEERKRGGPFRSLRDLLARVQIPESDGVLLIKAGALDSIEPKMNRAQLMWSFLAHSRAHSTVLQQKGAIGHLFALHGSHYPPPPLRPYDRLGLLHQEAEAMGFLISTHPLTLYEEKLKGLSYVTASEMKAHVGKEITLIGWCITSRKVLTSRNEPMEFVSFEDTTGIYETNLFPAAFRRFAHLVELNQPFILRGRPTDQLGCVTLDVHRIEPLAPPGLVQ